MNGMIIKCFKFTLQANFYLSVLVMLAACIVSFTGIFRVFEFNEELYGPLANNFRIMLLYLAISEIIICGFCIMTKKTHIMMVAGFFMVLAMGSLKFYGTINNLEIDPDLFLFFLYIGLSHIVFGVMAGIDKDRQIQA